eukprot:993897-Prorocentrum_minimum.AAC.7
MLCYLAAAGTGVLGNGVRLDADDLPVAALLGGAGADGILVLLDRLLVDHRPGAHRHVVVLGEHPPVKIGGHVVAHIHLRHVLVVLHLVVRDAHALLERDGVVVLTRVNLLGDARVGAVRTDDAVHLNLGGGANLRPSGVVVVVQGVHAVLGGGLVEAHHQTVDEVRAEGLRAAAQKVVHHLNRDERKNTSGALFRTSFFLSDERVLGGVSFLRALDST